MAAELIRMPGAGDFDEHVAQVQRRRERAARQMNWPVLAGQEPPPRRWILPGWLGYDPTLLAGSGGVGKTLIAQQLGTALATHRTFIEQADEPLTVLIWACEDDHDELWRRQVRINEHLGVDMGELTGQLFIEPRRGLDNTLLSMQFGEPAWTPLIEELAEQVNDLKADVLFLDNIGQTFGANESDRHHVTVYINGIVGITRRPFCPVMLAHPSRSSGSEFAGSGAWENAVRMRWLFGEKLPDDKTESETDQSVRYLSRRKSNYSQKDYRRFSLADGVLVPDDLTSAGGSDSAAIARRVVLEGLRKLRSIGIEASHNDRAGNYLPKLLMEHRINQGEQRSVLAKGLSDLLLDGTIVVGVVGRYSNRGAKEGLLEASESAA